MCPFYGRSSAGHCASHGRFAAPAALEYVGSRPGGAWGAANGPCSPPQRCTTANALALSDGSAAMHRLDVYICCLDLASTCPNANRNPLSNVGGTAARPKAQQTHAISLIAVCLHQHQGIRALRLVCCLIMSFLTCTGSALSPPMHACLVLTAAVGLPALISC